MKFKDLISVIDGDAILNIITESRHTTSKNVDWLVPQKGARASTCLIYEPLQYISLYASKAMSAQVYH